ncbi:MAG: hypothetical protein ABJB74_06025, partial [Gemmatimonas sp.]
GIPSQLHESFDNPTVPLPAERESHGSSQANFAEAPIAELLTAEQPVAESPISESRIAESPIAESPVAESPVAPIAARSGMRAVGGVRRGSTQVVAMNRVWIVAACVGAFTGGIGAFLLYNYVKSLIR